MEEFIKGLSLVDDKCELETVEKIVNQIKIENTDQVKQDNTLAIKTIADWLRKEENRDVVSKNEKLLNIIFTFIKNSVKDVVSTQPELSGDLTNADILQLEQICRFLGNLTFNHDDNRELLLNYKSNEQPTGKQILTSGVVAWFTQSKHATLRRNSITAMINLTSDDEPMQSAFASISIVVPTLINLILTQGSANEFNDIATKALRALIEDQDEIRDSVPIKDIKSLYKVVHQSVQSDGWIENDFAQDITKILVLYEQNIKVQEELLKEGILNELFNLIEEADSQRDQIDEIEDDEDLPKEGELSIAPLVSGVILKMANNDKLRHYFLDDPKIYDRIMKIVTAKPPVFSENTKKTQLKVLDITKVKRNITRLVGYISLEDKSIEKIMKDINIFIEMFNHEDAEQLVSAAMVIGNAANSDQNISKLLSLNILDIFTKAMKSYPNHQPIQHLLLSAVHNITSMKGPYKGSVANNDLLDCIIANMVVPNQVIQFTALGALKHLILCNETNFVNFINQDGLIALTNLANGITKAGIDDEEEEQKIKEVDETTDQQPPKKPAAEQKKDKRVAYEASRILLRFFQMRPLLKDEQKENHLVEECCSPFFELVNAPFFILKAEGIKGLLQLVKANSTCIFKQQNWFTNLSESLKSSIIAAENQNTPNHDKQFSKDIQTDILDILMLLVKDDDKCKELRELGAVSSLKDISKLSETSATTKANIQKILVQLTV